MSAIHNVDGGGRDTTYVGTGERGAAPIRGRGVAADGGRVDGVAGGKHCDHGPIVRMGPHLVCDGAGPDRVARGRSRWCNLRRVALNRGTRGCQWVSTRKRSRSWWKEGNVRSRCLQLRRRVCLGLSSASACSARSSTDWTRSVHTDAIAKSTAVRPPLGSVYPKLMLATDGRPEF